MSEILPPKFSDPVARWKATLGNEGKDFAIYEAGDGDTIAGLACLRGLKASEYRKWLTGELPATEHEEVSGTYMVPNTVIAYWAGAGGVLGRLYIRWRGNLSWLKRQGYKVEEHHFRVKKGTNLNAGCETAGVEFSRVTTAAGDLQSMLTAAMEARKLHGLYFWGHGLPSGLSADTGYYFGAQTALVDYRTMPDGYGLSLLWVYACHSASAQQVLGSGEPTMQVRGSAHGILIPLPFGCYVDLGSSGG
jgi:hypothetical protein